MKKEVEVQQNNLKKETASLINEMKKELEIQQNNFKIETARSLNKLGKEIEFLIFTEIYFVYGYYIKETLEECLTQCRNDSRCKSAKFRQSYKYCYLTENKRF